MKRILTLSLFFCMIYGQPVSAFNFGFGGKAKVSEKAKDYYTEARRAYGSASYAKVIKSATLAIKEAPKYAEAYLIRGKADKDMGDVDGAFKDLTRAIELEPKLGEAYFIRAQAHEIMGEMKQAGQDYKKGCDAGYKTACR